MVSSVERQRTSHVVLNLQVKSSRVRGWKWTRVLWYCINVRWYLDAKTRGKEGGILFSCSRTAQLGPHSSRTESEALPQKSYRSSITRTNFVRRTTMLSSTSRIVGRSALHRRNTLVSRAIRAKSTQVKETSAAGPIGADGRHEVWREGIYDHDNEPK